MASQMVSMNVMLAIHCKRTSYVDLYKPLKNFIRQQFSERDATDAEDDLQSVQAMRQAVERQGEGNLEDRKELLLKYFRTLSVMEARFPFGGEKPPLSHVSFTWQDAFKVSKKASQSSIVFEKAAIAFNLGATYSQMGLSVDRTTQDGLKKACHYFQSAAGAFAFLRDRLAARATGFMSTIDITPECAGMLERLMLGQAQECFFEKAIMDDKGPSLRARLAMQVGMFYEEASAALVLPPLSSQFDRSWVANVQCKALLFQGEALFHLSLHLRDQDEIAEEIARLRHAKELLQSAKKQGKGGLQPLVDSVGKLESTVERALTKAEQENDKVYLMRVPAYSSLPPITGAALASPISCEAALDAGQEKMFANIIPDSRTKDLSRYTDMVDEVVRRETERMQAETELAKVRLKELDLPELLQALESGVGVYVPQQLREDWQAAQVQGGVSGLQGELLQLQDLKRVNEGLLLAVDETLEKEAQEDGGIRAQFGSRWARPQSATLNKSLKDRATAFAGNLKQAGASDARIERDFHDSQELLSTLNHTRVDDLLPRISRPMVAVHGDEQAIVGRLRQLMGELEGLGAQRAALEGQLKDMRAGENIMPQLMNTPSGSGCEDLFKREIGKYEPVKGDVQRNIEAQRKLLDNLKDQTHLFCTIYNIADFRVELGKALKRVEGALGKYKELGANVREGLKFYVAMQDAIGALKQQCSDFVMTRNIQSRDLMDELQRQLSGLNFSGSSNANTPGGGGAGAGAHHGGGAGGAAGGGGAASSGPQPPSAHAAQAHAYPAAPQQPEQPRVAQPVGQPHQGGPGPGVVDSFINFLGNLAQKPGSGGSSGHGGGQYAPPHSPSAAAAPQAQAPGSGPQGYYNPPPAPYYSGPPAGAQQGQAPAYGSQSGGQQQQQQQGQQHGYGIQPGMYGSQAYPQAPGGYGTPPAHQAPGGYGAPPGQAYGGYGAPPPPGQAPNPYPQYNQYPNYRPS